MFLQWLFFFIVLAAVIFLSYVTTRFIAGNAGKALKGKYIRVVETVSIGIDKHLHLVKVGEQYVLISSSGKHIELLANIKPDDIIEDETHTGQELFNFKNIFEKYMQVFSPKGAVRKDPEPQNRGSYLRQSEQQDRGGSQGQDEPQNRGSLKQQDEPQDRRDFRSNLSRLRTITAKTYKRGINDKDESANDS